MGGVFPVNKTQKVYFGGVSDFPPEKVFCGGDLIWERPFGSVSPAKIADTDDYILCVGSSDMGCLLGATWSPHGSSDWHSVFRSDYTGSDVPIFEGITEQGINGAVTYGRVDINTIMTNAASGGYGAANPLTQMANYDILVMDTSDVMYDNRGDFPESPTELSYTQMARPYSWHILPYYQEWLYTEIMHKMTLIRLADANGIKQFWLTSPWPRLPSFDVLTPTQIAEWEARVYDPIRKSMEYQQDRLNAQCVQEGLGVTVKLIPYDILFRRFGEDVHAGLVPGITDMRQIRALGNSLDNTTPVESIDVPKHWYMLNYKGNYLINCLFTWLVHGDDPRGKPRADSRYTIPTDLATYMQNLAYEVGSTYPRGGRTVNPDPMTNRMPRLRNAQPAELLGNKLMIHRKNPVAGTPYSYPNDIAAYMLVLANGSNLTERSFTSIVQLLGSGAIMTQITASYSTEYSNSSFQGVSYDGVNTGSVTMGGLGYPIGATNRIAFEFFLPIDGFEGLSGRNFETFINRVDVDPHNIPSGQGKYLAGRNQTSVANTLTNRLFVPVTDNDWDILDVIVTNEVPTDSERFNLHRYLTREHQLLYNIEELWPDMVE